MRSDVKVSFIIPCYNESKVISTTLNKVVQEAEKNGLIYEIVVVDNMSNDGSFEEVKRLNIEPILSKGATVAEVRNDGFKKCRGDIVIFLDSDVLLGDCWGGNLLSVIDEIMKNKKIITGSHCSVPENLSQPFLSWYKGIEKDRRNTHLGTGHIIMHRDLFEDVGMFDGLMRSGEDYDFCQRARKKGAIIYHNDGLQVYHMGYPDGILEFLRRESWHGVSDFSSIRSFLKSKVAIVSVVFFFCHIVMVFSLFLQSIALLVFSMGFLISLLFLSVVKKFDLENFLDLVCKVSVSYLYFWGRVLSVIRLLESKRN